MRKYWTADDIEKLKNLYPDTVGAELCKIFGRKINAIYHKARELGLKKSKEFYSSEHSGRLNGIIGSSTRFQKGAPGWNKGKKQADYMTAESISRSASTRFKKGNVPSNYRPIGHENITVDGYVQVKVRDSNDHTTNFELKHRWIWEQVNGPIPENMIIEFVDGNKLNFEISNLVLRTRSDNMLNNSVRDVTIVKRYLKVKNPDLIEKVINELPGVIELKRNSLILNRKLNESSRKNKE